MNDLGEPKPTEKGVEALQAEGATPERVVWRKFDARLLPLCTSFFLLAFLVCLY